MHDEKIFIARLHSQSKFLFLTKTIKDNMSYRISGIIRFYNHVRQNIMRPMTEEQKNVLLSTIKQNVQKIEELCVQCNIKPKDLPARSRIAYYYLKNFDETQIKAENYTGTRTVEQIPKYITGEDSENSRIFQDIYEKMFNKSGRKIVVDYYPYSNLKSTVRAYGNIIHIRLSDILKDVPENVKRALATILLCKLERVKCPEEQEIIYKNYLSTPQMIDTYNRLRQSRSQKIVLGARGHVRNLEDSFNRVNARYFDRQLKKPTLTWSEERTHHILGHEDSAMNVIVISKSLDRRNVPIYVLDYIMYHELLHIKHGTTYKNGRKHVHTEGFREDEKKFIWHRAAEEWLKHNRV